MIDKMRARNSKQPHGTCMRYDAGCRCEPCRAAKSSYRKQRASEPSNGIVSAAKARAHLEALWVSFEISLNAVAIDTGLPKQRVQLIRSGTQAHCREETARKLLAVTKEAAQYNGFVPAEPTRQLIRALGDSGLSQRKLSGMLGKGFQIQIRRPYVLTTTADKVRRIYRLFLNPHNPREGRMTVPDKRDKRDLRQMTWLCRPEKGGCGRAFDIVRVPLAAKDRMRMGGLRSPNTDRMVAIHSDELIPGQTQITKMAQGTFCKLRRALEESCEGHKERAA